MPQRGELALNYPRFDPARHAALCDALRENDAYLAPIQGVFYPDMAPTQFEYFAAQLTAGFEALSALGANFHLHQSFFMMCIRQLSLSESLVPLLQLLKEHSINIVQGSSLLKLIADHPLYSNQIHTGLAALLSWPVAFQQDPALFESVVHHICEKQDSQRFVLCLALFKSRGISFEHHRDFFHALACKMPFANQLSARFSELLKFGASLHAHRSLFLTAINAAHQIVSLTESFDVLKAHGFSFDKHLEIFESCMRNACFGGAYQTLQKYLTSFKEHQVDFLANTDYCKTILEKHVFFRDFSEVFHALAKQGATPNEQPELFLFALRAEISKQAVGIFEVLIDFGFDISNKKFIKIFLESLSYRPPRLMVLKCFEVLQRVGLSPNQHEQCFESILKLDRNLPSDVDFYTMRFEEVLNILKAYHVSFEAEHFYILFEHAVPHVFPEHLQVVLGFFEQVGVDFQNNLTVLKMILCKTREHVVLEPFKKVFEFVHAFDLPKEQEMECLISALTYIPHIDQLKALIQALKALDIHLHDAAQVRRLMDCFGGHDHGAWLLRVLEMTTALQQRRQLVDLCLEQASHIAHIRTGFLQLQRILVTEIEYFRCLLQTTRSVSRYYSLADSFLALKALGADFKQDESLFCCLIEHTTNHFSPESFIDGCGALLEDHAAHLTQHFHLFHQMMMYADRHSEFRKLFSFLKSKSANLVQHEYLFDAAIQYAAQGGLFSESVQLLLEKAEVDFTHQEIYLDLFGSMHVLTDKTILFLAGRLCDFLSAIPIDKRVALLKFILADLQQAITFFNQLQQMGLTARPAYFIDHYLMLFSCMQYHGLLAHQILQAFSQYTRLHPLQALSEEELSHASVEMRNLCDRLMNNQITEGPLNQSDATRVLRALLEQMTAFQVEKWHVKTIKKVKRVHLKKGKRVKKITHIKKRVRKEVISVNQMKHFSMSFSPDAGYEIHYKNDWTIPLTLLLPSVTLSHLELDDALIEELGRYMSFLLKGALPVPRDAWLPVLTAPLQAAIRFYEGRQYKNMTRLLRGELLDVSHACDWILPTRGSKNFLIHLIAGILVHEAARRLRESFDHPAFETYLLREQDGLIRKENIDDQIFKRRMHAVQHARHAVSFSALPQGSEYLDYQSVTFHLQGDFSHFIALNQTEGEVLLPDHISLKYGYASQGFFAMPVCSPQHERRDTYASLQALLHAYRRHLARPYQDSPASFWRINATRVERPNHGLAHTFRVMEHIDRVIDYFARYAHEADFKRFCQTITHREIEWLRIAAAFSVTGREGEVAFKEDMALYQVYRQKSADYLEAFFQHIPTQGYQKMISSGTIPEKMRRLLVNIVRHLGDPAYEQFSSRQLALDEASSDTDRKKQLWMHRVLNIAHKLDLPRCYTRAQLQIVFADCLQFAATHVAAQEAWQQLVHHSIALIKAHGDRLYVAFDQAAELVDQYSERTDTFLQASTSIPSLLHLNEMVPAATI